MHMHVELNEKERLQEATTIIAAGGVTNGILGIVKSPSAALPGTCH